MGALDGVNIVRSIAMGVVTIAEIKEQLDELIDITAEEFSDLLSPEEIELLNAFQEARSVVQDAGGEEQAGEELSTELHAKRFAFLQAIQENRELPRQLKNDVLATLDALEIASDLAKEAGK
ncbi:MAG: hypothetical protein IJI68_13640 [Eggerthellaceae bacterium]|nr:hypothetical protein [Eggerthellaceae bacterium]